ncbi:MAG TPA: aminofutalosine synthase MqnE [Armatimonadota bacterium]|nr:aminofutalosine synthase MqnE [Armatimonadota bacterium]
MVEARLKQAGLGDIFERVVAGERLGYEDAVRLYRSPDLNALGYMANLVRERKNGDRAYFVRNQHINYTDVCNKFCKFCSFYAGPRDSRGYTLTPEDVQARVHRARDFPVTEIHMVGGINPALPYSYYLDIVRAAKTARPEAHVKAFTMVEMAQIVKCARKPVDEVFADLRAAGLDSMPGGGAEVLSDRIHGELFPLKQDGREWLEMARAAHRAGLRSNATMLYGHLETPEERAEHMVRLRELQDETGGFLTFIPLSFHPENTELDHLPPTTGLEDLRQLAVARLMLDNFEHIKSFWIMITPEVAQASLWYGADDVDGTIVEYEITRPEDGSTRQQLTRQDLIQLIVEAGRRPVERDNLYNVLETPSLAA